MITQEDIRDILALVKEQKEQTKRVNLMEIALITGFSPALIREVFYHYKNDQEEKIVCL